MSLRAAWRHAAATPIRNQRRTFMVVAAVLTVAATALHLTSAPPSPALPSVGQPVEVGAVLAPAPNSEAARTAIDARDAMTVARRFLRGYLADLYGHRTTSRHRSATTELRRRLASQRPRVSPATRKRRPRVRHLTVESGPDASAVRVVATIADGGPSTYPIGIAVRRQADGRLLVFELLEAH